MKKSLILYAIASMLMLCNNAWAQNAKSIADNLFTYYYDDSDDSYKNRIFSLSDNIKWYNYFVEQLGSDQTSMINKLSAYAEDSLYDCTADQAGSYYLKSYIHRFYAIKGYMESTNTNKDEIENAWLRLEKKMYDFNDEYITDCEIQCGGGTVHIIEYPIGLSFAQEIHRQLWESINNEEKADASNTQILAQIDRSIAKSLKDTKSSKLRTAIYALKSEIHKYATTLGKNCPPNHLAKIKEFIDNEGHYY